MTTSTQEITSRAVEHSASPTPPTSLDFNIPDEIERLRQKVQGQGGAWQKGIARQVLIAYSDLRATLIYLAPKAQIEEHYNPGRVIVHTVAGHIRMHAAGKTYDLPLGAVLALDRAVAHDVEALEESAFWLTVVPPAE